MKQKIVLFGILILLSIYTVAALPFNTTALDNSDNIFEWTLNLNTLVGFIGTGILLITFIITFVVISSRYNDTLAGIGAGSFISSVTAIILLPLGLIGFHVFRIVILVAALSIGASILINRA